MINHKTILNEEGEKIFIETYVPDDICSTVIFCHGITGCRKGRTKDDHYFQTLAEQLMNLNYKVVLFDFSGHGDSEGNDFDVSLSKSTKELEKVVQAEVEDIKNVNFLAFSYGATVLCNFLSEHPSIHPNHIVFYSPCFFPLESCFLNSESLFGKDIVRDYESGQLQKNGYAIVGAKNFRFGFKMIEDCKPFRSDYVKKFSDRILVLSGSEDVILDTKYNDSFCEKHGIRSIYLKASHSLFEAIDQAFLYTISFYQDQDIGG